MVFKTKLLVKRPLFEWINLFKFGYHFVKTRVWYSNFIGSTGKGTIIRSPIEIDGPENIFLGKRVRIAPNSWLCAKKIVNDLQPRLIIGDGTAIGRFFHCVVSRQIAIGRGCLINERVYISDATHNYEDLNVPIIEAEVLALGSVNIGDGAWIGEGAMIFGNIRIGKHAVIGAGAVVRADVPDYGVAVGVPARVVKIISNKNSTRGYFND